MAEQPHPENAGINVLLRLRAAYEEGKANRLKSDDTLPATMLEIGFLLHMFDQMAVVSAATEAAGAQAGWDAAVNLTANTLGKTADVYRAAMLARNPFTEEAKMLLELASVPEGTKK